MEIFGNIVGTFFISLSTDIGTLLCTLRMEWRCLDLCSKVCGLRLRTRCVGEWGRSRGSLELGIEERLFVVLASLFWAWKSVLRYAVCKMIENLHNDVELSFLERCRLCSCVVLEGSTWDERGKLVEKD